MPAALDRIHKIYRIFLGLILDSLFLILRLGLMTGRNARSEIILDGGGEMLFRIARTGESKPILL